MNIPIEKDRGAVPQPSFAQERLWYLANLGHTRSTDTYCSSWVLEGDLDVKALQRSFGAILRRHDVLRTRFDAVNDRCVLLIDEPDRFDLKAVDLTEFAEEQRWIEADHLVAENALKPFDLAGGPLF